MKPSILYVGKDVFITKVMIRLLNAKDIWTGYGVTTLEEAVEVCKTSHLDLVLLGNGLDVDEEKLLKKEFSAFQPELKIIQHYGGGSGLLYAEITGALA